MDNKTLRLKILTLPNTVRQWFSSEEVAMKVKTINQHFNITDEDQRKIIPRLLLRLEIQDLEPDYFAGELAEELKIDSNRALAITTEIKRMVLGPIKKDLSDLEIDMSLMDKFQAPIIKKPAEPPSAFAPVMISKTEPVKPVTEIKLPLLPAVKTAEPSPFSKPIGEIKPFTPSSSMPLGVNRAEKSSVPPISPLSPGKPTAPPTPSMPPPMILHEEPASAPLKKEFRLEMPQPKLSEIKLKSEVTKPAVLEFGPSAVETTESKQAASDKVRVVHYTETPAPTGKAPAPTVPSPGREIKEITAPSFSGSDILKQLAASEAKTPTPPPPAPKPPTPPPIPKPPMAPIPPTMNEVKPPVPPLPRPRVEPPRIESKPGDTPKPSESSKI